MELTINRKQVKVGLKMGLSREGFCQKYGCEPLEFDEHLMRIYGSDEKELKDIYSEMKSNEKRVRRSKKRQAQNSAVQPEQVQALTEEISRAAEETGDKVCPVTDGLGFLKQREKTLSDEIICLEEMHKSYAKNLHECRKVLREIKGDIKELQKQLNTKCQQFDDAVADANGCIKNMNDISAARRPKVEELASIRRQIEELSTITLCVYDNGTMGTLDGGDLVLDATGSEELYLTIREAEFCEELRVKDVKVLARAIAAVKNSELTVNLLFDRPEVEAAYNRYLASV